MAAAGSAANPWELDLGCRVLPAAGAALVEAVPAEDHAGGPQQDLEVQAPAAVLDVPEVELDAVAPRQRGATVDLRPAGEPGLDGQAPALAVGVLRDLDRDRRPRADDGHVAAQHIDQVRYLVERRAPQEAPHSRDPRVA